MLYTCSHKNYKSTNYKTYAISGNRGKDANYHGDCFPKLAPKLLFWNNWHNSINLIPEYENNYYYIENYYYQVLKNLNPQEIVNLLDNSVLLCYEESDEFCHRHIVAAWLELLLNITVPEVIITGTKIIQVNRPAYIKEFLKHIISNDLSYPEDNNNCEILVNRNNVLTPSFVPNDLIITDDNKNNFHQYINPNLKPMVSQSIYPYYIKMKNDMSKQNLNIIIDSGYRSYEYQHQIMDSKIAELGYEKAKKLVAPPGASEHQTGLAFDIALIKNNEYCPNTDINDLEIRWLMENSYKYGFILRYPMGKEHITTYMFEPWHYRYVGLRLAKLLTQYNLTLEEYYQYKQEYDELYNKNVKSRRIHYKIKKS